MKKNFIILLLIMFLIKPSFADEYLVTLEYSYEFESQYRYNEEIKIISPNFPFFSNYALIFNNEKAPKEVKYDNYSYVLLDKSSNKKVTQNMSFILLNNSVEINEKTFNYSKELPKSIATYLNNSSKINVKNPKVIKQANEIKSNSRSNYEVISKTINYVVQNMRYTYDSRYSNKGSDFAISNFIGNCEDYSSLVVALLRANNIPSRTMSGFSIPIDTKLETDLLNKDTYNLHMWVEIYSEDKGWIPIEVTKTTFEEETERVKINSSNALLTYFKPFREELKLKSSPYLFLPLKIENGGYLYQNAISNDVLSKVKVIGIEKSKLNLLNSEIIPEIKLHSKYRVEEKTCNFEDTKEKENWQFACTYQVMTPYDDNTIHPQSNLTLLEFLKMLDNSFLIENKEIKKDDLNIDSKYYFYNILNKYYKLGSFETFEKVDYDKPLTKKDILDILTSLSSVQGIYFKNNKVEENDIQNKLNQLVFLNYIEEDQILSREEGLDVIIKLLELENLISK